MACEKTIKDNSDNPFGGGGDVIIPPDSVDAESIRGLHQNIFAQRCANPNCHDGSFEPDFRTVESTYQTLIYQQVIKNDSLNSFTYRVHPGKADESWLMERLLTDDVYLGRMPLYAVPLSDEQLQNVKNWINKGAPDSDGNTAVYPNLHPKVRYFIAYDTSDTRIDTNRVSGWSSAFQVPNNLDFYIVVALQEDSTAIKDLLINKMYFSTDKDDFTGAQVINGQFYKNTWFKVSIPQGTFTAGQQVYFRYEVNDPDHTTSIVYPNNNNPWWIKQNASFIIQ